MFPVDFRNVSPTRPDARHPGRARSGTARSRMIGAGLMAGAVLLGAGGQSLLAADGPAAAVAASPASDLQAGKGAYLAGRYGEAVTRLEAAKRGEAALHESQRKELATYLSRAHAKFAALGGNVTGGNATAKPVVPAVADAAARPTVVRAQSEEGEPSAYKRTVRAQNSEAGVAERERAVALLTEAKTWPMLVTSTAPLARLCKPGRSPCNGKRANKHPPPSCNRSRR